MLAYEILDLVKEYPGLDHPANDHISLQIQAGEIFGLLGDNGAGKTTLVRQMANLIRSTSGRIDLFGQPVGKHPLYVPQLVGYMPQGPQALNNLTVWEAIYYTAHLRGMDRQAARQETESLLETWDIRPLRRQVNTRLSGGQRRLLQLAVAMAGNPAVLMLDEPTNDLDPQRRRQVWEVLRERNRQGTTIFFITHDALEAEKIIQRVGILRAGKLVALGKPSALKASVDQKLRLELFFSPGRPPQLPSGYTPLLLDPGRWLVYLEREQAHQVLNQLDLNALDDFRLYSATLEDLYIYYAQPG